MLRNEFPESLHFPQIMRPRTLIEVVCTEISRREYELFTSEVVDVEVAEGDEALAEARLKALDGIPRLPAQPEVDELIDHLLGSGIIPAVAAPDAAHIHRLFRRPRDGFPADLELQTHQQPPSRPPHRARVRRAWASLPGDLHAGRTPATKKTMQPNPILTEIRRTRDELARKSGYDVRKFMDFIREREHEALARGMEFAPVTKPATKAEQ